MKFSVDHSDLTERFKAIGLTDPYSEIYLNGLNLTDDEIIARLAKSIQNPVNVLILSQNKISSIGNCKIITYLINNKHFNDLQNFNLTANNIGLEGSKALVSFINTHKKLKVLKLSNCDIEANAINVLGESLKNSAIEVLDLDNNPLKDLGILHLCNSLKESTHLRDLSLAHCEFRKGGCRSLMSLLVSVPSLKSLRLTQNPIGDEEAALIITALKVNSSLQSLCLSWTNIGDLTFDKIYNDILCEKASYRKSLRRLKLSGTKISRNCLGTLNKLMQEGLHCEFGIKPLNSGLDLCNCFQMFSITDIEKSKYQELAEKLDHDAHKVEYFTESDLRHKKLLIEKHPLEKIINLFEKALTISCQVKDLSIAYVLLNNNEGNKLFHLLPQSIQKLNLLSCEIFS